MTKQEEIREGIKNILSEHFGLAPTQEPFVSELPNKIIKYLHSQGVVIKVDRELGKTPIGVADWSKISMEEVEPLIEE